MSRHGARWIAMADALGSWRLWLAVAAVVAITPLLSLLPVGRGRLIVLVCGVAAAIALLLVVWVGWWLLLRHLSGGWRLATAVPVVVLAALTRGFLLQALLDAQQYARYWVVSSCVTVGIAVITGLLLKVGVDGHRRRLEELAAEQQRLTAVLAAAEQELRWRRQESIAEVGAAVTTGLSSVPDSSLMLTADSLERLVEDVVRPLSHELAASVPTWEPPYVAVRQPLDWSRVWGTVADVKLLDPWALAIVVLLATPPSIVASGWRLGVTMHLLMAAATIVSVLAVRRVAGGRGRRLPTPIRLVMSYASLVVACVPAAAIAVTSPGQTSNAAEALWVLVVLPLSGLLLSAVRAARVQQRDLEAQAAAAAQQTAWWISRTRMVSWWQRAIVARALHGPVQSAILAVVHRLRGAQERGGDPPDLTFTALADLRRSVATAVVPEVDGHNPSVRLQELRDTWRLVADVEVTLPAEPERLLYRDPICCEMAIDAICEAVSNAIRHGGARSIEVSIRLTGAAAVRIEVDDDGRGMRQDQRGHGLGTLMLDACALAWGFESQAGRNLLWLDLPLLAQDAPPSVATTTAAEGVRGLTLA
jgi:signal transduction histidine kinase